MPLIAHLLLLVGMFLAILVLITSSKLNPPAPGRPISYHKFDIAARLTGWIGYTAMALIAAALFILPFRTQNSDMKNSQGHTQIADRAFVEKAIFHNEMMIIDARPESQYVMGHIAHSLNIPYNTSHLDRLLQPFALTEKLLILYCSDSRCNTADILAKRLQDCGCKKIAIYAGGWKDWSRY